MGLGVPAHNVIANPHYFIPITHRNRVSAMLNVINVTALSKHQTHLTR
jgi:hypothetical protein